MSTNDFLRSLISAGEEYTKSNSTSNGIISRVKIEFGLHRYVSGHDFWSFWKPVNGENEVNSVAEELIGRMKLAGSTDKPKFGVKITIDKNVLSRELPYKKDLMEFIADWKKDAFSLIVDSVESANLPVGEWFYGRVQYKDDPFYVKKGDAGKTDTDQDGNPRFPSIRVPVEKFNNENEARLQCGNNGNTTVADSNGQWSQTALENYGPDMSKLEEHANEINHWVEEALKGTPFANNADAHPLPIPLTPPTAKKYIADCYHIEPSDIDLLIPF